MSDIYGLLQDDHRRLAAQLDGVDPHDGEAFRSFGAELMAHAEAEEATFYAALDSYSEAAPYVADAKREHVKLRALSVDLDLGQNVDLAAATLELKTALLDHVEDEEGAIFDAARRLLSAAQVQAVGEEFSRRKQAIGERAAARA